jgi:hypothetical protein
MIKSTSTSKERAHSARDKQSRIINLSNDRKL